MSSDMNTSVPENHTAGSGDNPCVLIIDDEDTVREAITDILALEGIPVLSAADGRHGIDLYARKRDQISLVILDLSMPGLSGEETLQGLRAVDPRVRVMLSSGYTAGEAEQKVSADETAGFLQKPYKVDTLLEEIRRLLGKKR